MQSGLVDPQDGVGRKRDTALIARNAHARVHVVDMLLQRGLSVEHLWAERAGLSTYTLQECLRGVGLRETPLRRAKCVERGAVDGLLDLVVLHADLPLPSNPLETA